MRNIHGGDATSGGPYIVNGQTKQCASDCYEWIDGRLHGEFYDKDGNLQDETWRG